MTTIPGHNIVIQQSGAVHEATHHLRPNQPDPEAFAAQQAAMTALEKTRISKSTDTQAMAADREKEKKAQRLSTRNRTRKKKRKGELEPDKTGNLLDTVA